MGEGKSFAQCVCKSVFVGAATFEKSIGGTLTFAYVGIRDQGLAYEQVHAIYAPMLNFGALKSTSGYSDFVTECEAGY